MTIKFGWEPSRFYKLPFNEQLVIVGEMRACNERKDTLGGGI